MTRSPEVHIKCHCQFTEINMCRCDEWVRCI